MFIDGKFVGSFVDARIDRGLNGLPPELEIIPKTTYSNVGAKAVFTISLSITADVPGLAGDVIDAFPGLVGSGHMDLQIPVEFRLGSPTELEIEAGLSTLQAQATPFLGLAGMLVDFLGVSLQAFIDSAARSALSGLESDEAACEVTPQHSIVCTRPIGAPSPGGMPFGILSLIPQAEGFSLAGNLRAPALTPAALDISARRIRLEPPTIDCSTAGLSTIAAFSSDPRGWEILHGEIFITNLGTAPLTLCDYQVRGNDWARAFPRAGLRPDGTIAPIRILARFAAPDARYYQGDGPARPADYPCIVLVTTSAGTRAVSLGHAPVITGEDLDDLRAELLRKVGDCQILTDNWWDGNHPHNPDWHIPDPPDLRPGHHWHLELEGLNPGEIAALVDHGGVEARSRRRAGRCADPPFHGRSAGSGPEGHLPRQDRRPHRRGRWGGSRQGSIRSMEVDKGGKAGADERPTRGISTFQQSLIPIGSVRLDAPCLEVVASRGAGAGSVVTATPEYVTAYDLTNPLQPTMVGRWPFEGCRGAVPWKGGVLAFGDEGLALIEGDRMHRIDECRCEAFPVRSAAVTDGQLFALTDEGVTMLDARLRRLRKLDMKNGRSRAASWWPGLSWPWDPPMGSASCRRTADMNPAVLRHGMSFACDGCPDRPRGCRERVCWRNSTMDPRACSMSATMRSRSLRSTRRRLGSLTWSSLGNVLARGLVDANRLELYRLGPRATGDRMCPRGGTGRIIVAVGA